MKVSYEVCGGEGVSVSIPDGAYCSCLGSRNSLFLIKIGFLIFCLSLPFTSSLAPLITVVLGEAASSGTAGGALEWA